MNNSVELKNDQHYDVIIIGGGLGGLTAGAKLAKEGKKVLLIEQHYVVGGCATIFKRKGFTFEVGLHEMDGMDRTDLKSKIFQELGIMENINLIKAPELYRFKNERIDITIPHNSSETIKRLTEIFPEEKTGIENFFQTIDDIREEVSRLSPTISVTPQLFPKILSQKDNNIGDFLDSIIQNEELKTILLGNLIYYGDDPYKLSLIFYSAAHAGYFKSGYFIEGGSQNLSNYLAKYISEKQGNIVLKNLVTKIILEQGKAIGVEFRKTHGKNESTTQAFAKTIIFNGSLPLLGSLLPQKEREISDLKSQKFKIACSLFSVYLGLKRSLREIGNRHYSTFYFPKNIHKQSDISKSFAGLFSEKIFGLIDYSQIDPTLSPSGQGTATITTVDYLTNWENLSEEEYKNKKREAAEILINRLEEDLPGISNEIEYYEVATPRTIQRYTLNYKGTPYGYAQTPDQSCLFRPSNKSDIPNLYFASAWTQPGHGFTGAIVSGWLCANKILNTVSI